MKNVIDFIDGCSEKTMTMVKGKNSLLIDFLLEKTLQAAVSVRHNSKVIEKTITKGKQSIVEIPEEWFLKTDESVITLDYAEENRQTTVTIYTEYGEKTGDMRIVKEHTNCYKIVFFSKNSDQQQKNECCIDGSVTRDCVLIESELIIGEVER
ncbi:MAG: hypothetical protein K2M46_10520 [Lachnospiraceae bacterium]|nr:hypothetical protein [Lachnospiraceae bacterium]